MRFFASLAIVGFLLGCSDGTTSIPLTEAEQDAQSTEQYTVVRLTSANIGSYDQPARPTKRASLPKTDSWSYVIGAGDILSILVYDHPELNMPAGPDMNAIDNGFLVQSDGTFFYPHIGKVSAAGRSIEAVRNDITQRLRTIIPEPQVVAKVVSYDSQKVVVGGEVETPNHQALTTVPLTLLQAINAAGGYTEEADTARISLQRAGKRYTVDLDGFLKSNYLENNPTLQPGDIVNVPERRVEEAFILGEVDEPDVVDLSEEQISLTQALTYRGGLVHVRSDARGVFVFRGSPQKPTVFQLDTTTPNGWILGTRFTLMEDDVVYVTRSPLIEWNDTISRILPTIIAVNSASDIVN
ncbi:polysaccharide biosynthesis/export family protein [Shimia haliotis]|uniref:Polysaccharide export outer membrane protein n=1 Tax=Shimia haliotis TaxID=1280847 RepID=A0A1I4D983_9RHOB|nr:polysaccharide biosynthesis/export family protein [Shimia haliotis]SFK90042.1 polysaccharide export outer membrane protein [Shimia haliotis]